MQTQTGLASIKGPCGCSTADVKMMQRPAAFLAIMPGQSVLLQHFCTWHSKLCTHIVGVLVCGELPIERNEAWDAMPPHPAALNQGQPTASTELQLWDSTGEEDEELLSGS